MKTEVTSDKIWFRVNKMSSWIIAFCWIETSALLASSRPLELWLSPRYIC